MRRLLLLGVLALAVVPAASARSTNPCALVTAADAGKALGAKVRSGKPHTRGSSRSCTYANGRKRLTVLVRRVGKAAFEQSAKGSRPPVFPLPGIGGVAYSVGGGAALLVWQKGTELELSFAGLNPPVQAQTDVARAALGRL